jgi:hypothetical protein
MAAIIAKASMTSERDIPVPGSGFVMIEAKLFLAVSKLSSVAER